MTIFTNIINDFNIDIVEGDNVFDENHAIVTCRSTINETVSVLNELKTEISRLREV